MASTGGVRAARRAGTAAATTLTSVPVTTETATVKPSSGMLPDISMPNRPNTSRSTDTRPTPAATPSTEPSTPTTTACTRIDTNTCVGEAPIARSMANSRCRWRTLIWKVLAMMKAPTKSAMPAKTSRNVEMKPSTDSISARLSARSCSPVTTSASSSAARSPTASRTSSTSCSSLTPSSA